VTPPELVDHLGPDERLLWWGRAVQGRFGESLDAAPAFVAGGAGFVLVIIGLGRAAAGIMVTVALVLLGLGLIGSTIAAVVIGERHRRESIYAITDRRLLFLLWQRRGGPRRHALPLTEPVYPSVRVNASGSGNISFKADFPLGWRREVRHIERWTFEGIADVRAVFDIYQRAVDDLRRETAAISAAASLAGRRPAG
jgi:hypothetical protein